MRSKSLNFMDRNIEVSYVIHEKEDQWFSCSGDPGTPGFKEIELISIDYLGREIIGLLSESSKDLIKQEIV